MKKLHPNKNPHKRVKVFFLMYAVDRAKIKRIVESGEYESVSYFIRRAVEEKLSRDHNTWKKKDGMARALDIKIVRDLYSVDILRALKKFGELTTPQVIVEMNHIPKTKAGLESGVRRRLSKLLEKRKVERRWIPRSKRSDNQADLNTGCWMWRIAKTKFSRMHPLSSLQVQFIKILIGEGGQLELNKSSRKKYGNSVASLIRRNIIERDVIKKRHYNSRNREYIKDTITLVDRNIPIIK